MASLNWPEEAAGPAGSGSSSFVHARSNICLDFHGDPLRARLVVLSDGNHHMALREALAAFLAQHPAVDDIFYSTTPPRVALQWLSAGHMDIGNLRLSAKPHVMIGPPPVLDQAVADGYMAAYRPFMRSRGVALLVRKGNPKRIVGAADLLRDGVKLFLSNPLTEKQSYGIYREALQQLAVAEGLSLGFLDHAPGAPDHAKLLYGEAIHHREAPQALADDRADVAVVFYHLALRYQRLFPELFDLVQPAAWARDDQGEIGRADCGLVGDGGAWGGELLEFFETEVVTRIYRAHGLERAGQT
ncbi:MAG: substrate-binding domain-containing protein [Rhodocyclales bacterium]|nr:substrate-binding domain-containing protein [Rhodocyclales bacterium]